MYHSKGFMCVVCVRVYRLLEIVLISTQFGLATSIDNVDQANHIITNKTILYILEASIDSRKNLKYIFKSICEWQ